MGVQVSRICINFYRAKFFEDLWLLQLGACGAVVAAFPRQQCNRVRAVVAAAAAWLWGWRQ